MSTSGSIYALIVPTLIILGSCISPDSAKAEEPGEDVIQELVQGDARAASAASWRAPFLGVCKRMEEKNKSDQSPAQSGPGTSVNDPISSICKLYDLLARGEFKTRKVGCVKSENSLGYNCDFIIQPKEGEQAATIGQFFNPDGVYTSRFVPFGSKWYLAQETSPFAGAGLIKALQ